MNSKNMFQNWERSLIESCPPSGNGVHDWTFKVLRMLSLHYASKERLFAAARTIFDLFATRAVDDGEIRRQLGNARRSRPEVSFTSCSDLKASIPPCWPLPDIVNIEKIVRSGTSLAQLRTRSPIPKKESAMGTAQVLDWLFPGDPLLCCARSINSPETRALSCWANLDEYQFIVPSPMSSLHGKTQDGRPSYRALDNTGARRFLVVEFDFKADSEGASRQGNIQGCRSKVKKGNALEMGRMVSQLKSDGYTVQDMCAALIAHLSMYINPAMVVSSGGKSLHSWFLCAEVEEQKVRQLMRYAVSLGGDPHTWVRCQFVRMPGGRRDNGVRQEIIYFNPEACHE